MFSNSQHNLNKFLSSMEKYYQVSLDTTAESFLGIHFNHLNDGSVVMTQPKLMQKVLKEYPKIERYVSKKHPYGPTPSYQPDTRIDTPSQHHVSSVNICVFLDYYCILPRAVQIL